MYFVIIFEIENYSIKSFLLENNIYHTLFFCYFFVIIIVEEL